MVFRSVVQVRASLMQAGSTFEVSPASFPGVRVALRTSSLEELARKLREREAICTTIYERDAGEKVRAMFDSLARGRLPPGG
jgi:hypothetical protein